MNKPLSKARPTSFSVAGVTVPVVPAPPGLHIVATPIGHLGDISLRALGLLAGCDLVLAEDTRTSKTLLAHYGVATALLPYHEHNAAEMRPRVLERLRRGEALALISDAGTPLVSDPGYKLVAAVVEAGLPVSTVPGASAALAALVVAGLPTDRFFFEGFLPPKGAARRARLTELAAVDATLIFYESPRRLAEMLADATAVFGPRAAAVARELTKMHETVRRGPLPDLAAHYTDDEEPRGEIVVVVAAPLATEALEGVDEAIETRLRTALASLSLKEAVAQVAADTGQPRRKVYARALELTRTP